MAPFGSPNTIASYVTTPYLSIGYGEVAGLQVAVRERPGCEDPQRDWATSAV